MENANEENPNSSGSSELEFEPAPTALLDCCPYPPSRTPFTSLAQVDSDLTLASVLQEQERAYMMLMDGGGGHGSTYASSESGSYAGQSLLHRHHEVIKKTMEKLPVMKELIDSYCGPDRVTTKQQQQELERVAKTLPENVPSSVKRFTDRAVLSLQSNPGWGFDKKCQFMDKLVWEVTQHYK